ncbi:MAG TPA: hypothetical protein PKK12_00490 [Candidatus Aminicenantes bacterium]|nr:hypothetical protein [Candidatus Aminicenantes bacterium]
MARELTETQRSALFHLHHFLGEIASANDAEDHGYDDEARRMRDESCGNILRLLRDAPFLGEIFPRLEAQIEDQSLFVVGWVFLQREIEALVTKTSAGPAHEGNGT